jgi:molecular chaperone HscB
MNYFELFEIPIQLKVDVLALKTKYYALSRKFHPDHNINSQQDISLLEKSAMLNKAWATFQNEEATLYYFLTIHNYIEPEEKYALDNAFLMNIMELKEAQMDAEMDGDETKQKEITQAYQQIANTLRQQFNECNTQFLTEGISDSLLFKLKEIYYKRKYLDKNR